MIMNDSGINVVRRKVGSEVCRLEWEGNLDQEHVEKLIHEISPGPKPLYRCCVYKEREIVRGRVRLASGMNAVPGSETKNVVQVVEAACDDCPISSYTVTDNCRFCLGKACLSSCKFGAISLGPTRMHIDPAKCKECGMCAKSCPFGAIVHLERPCKKACPVDAISYDEYGFCRIDEEKCIHCGHCIHNCPFGAIGAKSFLTNIIRDIKAGKEVYAMCAPASEGQFGKDIGMASIKNALKKIGFVDMVEVGLGGDMTAAYEAKEWIEARAEGRKMTTSCCPAWVNLVWKHLPELVDHVSLTPSPMVYAREIAKAKDPNAKTVFIGPCVAKRSEARRKDVDYVLSFEELGAILAGRKIDVIACEPWPVERPANPTARNYAKSCGVTDAVLAEATAKIPGFKLDSRQINGIDRKTCTMVKLHASGKIPVNFLEVMACPGGCQNGPCSLVK